MENNVSVLFVRKDSVYKTFVADCWDADRDARNYTGSNPVVCHPPCRFWGRLSAFSKHPPGEPELALFSVDLIRKNGGVLEHPAYSRLWEYCQLPYGDQVDSFGGFSLHVNQWHWGHRAWKETFLYVCGFDRSNLPFVTFKPIGTSIKPGAYGHRLEVSKKEREATPVAFATWLVGLAVMCKPNVLRQ